MLKLKIDNNLFAGILYFFLRAQPYSFNFGPITEHAQLPKSLTNSLETLLTSPKQARPHWWALN